MKNNNLNIQETIKRLFNKNLIGIKQSFEDEGSLLDDVKEIRKATEINNLKLSVKIGGCEAKSDIHQCKLMGVNGIVAPMIETEFALQKFTESVSNITNIKFYINIESKTGYENIDKILDSPSSKMLSGVVVGRSDLVKSYGHDKSLFNSDFIFDKTYEIMKKAKSYGLETLMGGNLSPDSFDFISKLKKEELIDYVETRNTIIKVDNISELKDDITSAFEFESIWLDFKYRKYKEISEERAMARHTESLTYIELLEGTSKLLSEIGSCAFIIPFSEEENFIALAKQCNLFVNRITRVKGTEQAAIKRSLLQFSFIEKTTEITELIIELERHLYTDDYKKIVQDFYLKM